MLLEKVVLWVFVEATPIASIDCTNLANHNKAAKAKQIVLDLVKDHLTPHIIEKKLAKEMFDAMSILY